MSKPVDLTPRREMDLFTSENLNQPITEMVESANQNDAQAGVRDGCFREQHLPSLLGNIPPQTVGTGSFGAKSLTIEDPDGPTGFGYFQSDTNSTYLEWGMYDVPAVAATDENGWIPIQDVGGTMLELDFTDGNDANDGVDLTLASKQNIEGVLVMFNCRLQYINKDFTDAAVDSETRARDTVGFTLQFLSPAGAGVAWRPLGFSERYYCRSSGNWMYDDPQGTGASALYGELFSINNAPGGDFPGWGKHEVDISIRILLTEDVLLRGGNADYVTATNLAARPVEAFIKRLRACVCVTPYENGGVDPWNSTTHGGIGVWGVGAPPPLPSVTQTVMKCTLQSAQISAILLQSDKILSVQ